MTSSPRPLDGLFVVDSAEWPGEICGRLLADLGATVVRVEPHGGAASRTRPPIAYDADASFAWRNANKLGATSDRLDELLAAADVWIETAGDDPDPAEVVERHPDLIVTSITPFGRTGPAAGWAATEPVVLAAGGLLYRAGTPDRPPVTAPGCLASDAAGVMAAFATLLAVLGGGGIHLDVSAAEAVAQLADWALPGWSQSRIDGHRTGSGAVYPIYECADGHVRMVSPLSPREWHTLKDWLGHPEQIEGPEWENVAHRMVNGAVIKELLAAFCRDRERMELATDGMDRGIAVSPIFRPGEVITSPLAVGRGTFVDAEVAPGETAKVMAGVFVVDGERLGFRTRAPEVGEHNASLSDFSSRTRPRDGFVKKSRDGGPLAGVRVLDFGVGGVGPETGRLLAEYGADVVKVESIKHPDFMRMVLGSDINANWASSNRSKRSLGVDLTTDDGRALVRRLVVTADVLVENSGTGAMGRLGLGPADLLALNPRIVVASSQLMGSTGPWAHWKGYGPNARAVGGLTWLWCHPDQADAPPGTTTIHPDHFVGRVLGVATLAMLVRRAQTDAGGHAEVAQAEVVINQLADLLLREARAPDSVQPLGNTSEWAAPWDVYPCAGEDEWCVITVRSDDDWNALQSALGKPDWASDPAYTTAPRRVAGRERLDAALSEWTTARSANEVVDLLQGHGVPAAVAAHPSTQFEDPQFNARRFMRPVHQPGVGDVLYEGPAFHATPPMDADVRAAPLLGEHTRQVCRDWLDMSDADIDALVASGVLEERSPDA